MNKDKGAIRRIITKVVRSTLYLAAFTTCPAILNCVYSQLGVPLNRFSFLLTIFTGATIAFMIEPPTRHI